MKNIGDMTIRKIRQQILFLLLVFPFTLIAFEPQLVTPYPVVGYQELSFFDELQKMQRQALVWYPINPQVPGEPSKNSWDLFHIAINAPPLQTKIKRPLIVISHGYTGTPHQLSWLIRRLVYEGFFVLAIQHLDLIQGKINSNLWQRPLDIKTLLDQFFASSLAEAVNKNYIAIAGYSLGGTTAIWLAGGRVADLDAVLSNPDLPPLIQLALPTLNKDMMGKDWRDARIKAAFVMSPAWGWVFAEESLAKISIPTYVIAGTEDHILGTRNQAAIFARHIPRSIYQMIPGKTGHFIFVSALNEKKMQAVNPSGQINFLLVDDASIDRSWIQFQVAEEAVKFFKSVFIEAESLTK